MGRRQRQRARLAAQPDDTAAAEPDDSGAAQKSEAGRRAGGKPESEYRDAEGNVLALRGSLSAAARREYTGVLTGGLDRDDAAQRAVELLFERLAVSWSIAGLQVDRQRELLGRYRMASAAEREFVREALREHVAQHFPELEVP